MLNGGSILLHQVPCRRQECKNQTSFFFDCTGCFWKFGFVIWSCFLLCWTFMDLRTVAPNVCGCCKRLSPFTKHLPAIKAHLQKSAFIINGGSLLQLTEILSVWISCSPVANLVQSKKIFSRQLYGTWPRSGVLFGLLRHFSSCGWAVN